MDKEQLEAIRARHEEKQQTSGAAIVTADLDVGRLLAHSDAQQAVIEAARDLRAFVLDQGIIEDLTIESDWHSDHYSNAYASVRDKCTTKAKEDLARLNDILERLKALDKLGVGE